VIVCSCNVISDHQVRSVTSAHTVRGTSEVYRCLGCSVECGRCARTIRKIIAETVGEATLSLPASPSICASAELAVACATQLAAGDGDGAESDLLLSFL
jgi:bacterioferritin-associated ferredoxin